MTGSSLPGKRIDTASRLVKAPPDIVYNAFVDPNALISWLPPEGMKGRICEFDARAGGAYRMELTYLETDGSAPGKTSENTDVVEGRFLAFEPNEKIVQTAVFESEDAAFSGEMIMTWTFTAVPEGTLVTIVCENVPAGIRKEDHDAGLSSTLGNLAGCAEREVRGT